MATTDKEQHQPKGTPKGGVSKDGTPRLTWASKPAVIERVSLPFQVVETINESRVTREAFRGSLFDSMNASPSITWRNKLIWGDNKLVMGSLLKEFAGQVRLIYIDPPFATGDDFSIRVRVGDSNVVKEPSILEEHAYRDTWGAGYDSYLSMMYERLLFIHELLAEDGSLYLHCGQNVVHFLEVLCDEIFGRENFRNVISWRRANAHNDPKRFGRISDFILYYGKTQSVVWNPQYTEYRDDYYKSHYTKDQSGRWFRTVPLDAPRHGEGSPNLIYEWKEKWPAPTRTWAVTKDRMEEYEREELLRYTRTGTPTLLQYADEMPGVPLQDFWADVPPVNPQAHERIGYPTQKPEALLERIITSSSNPGDLVGDFFVGSGTTSVVAERLERRWIGCDLGRFAIHTTRKRLLNTPGCSPFEILNLGVYERQHWQQATTGSEIDAYLGFILALYETERIKDYAHLHGKKGNRLVHVGAVDAPVTMDEIEQVMDELATNDLRAADVLGWEWEMGLHDVVGEEARRRGLDVACRQIPREVMKAEVGDEVRFFELAYLDLEVDRDGRSARVQLRDFVIPSDELIPEVVRSKITQWSDYIDYWAVDFNFHDDTFHNEWQAYRTREEPKLATESDWHDYEEPGRYAIVVKVIDIFGNDTTKLAEVTIK